MKKRILSTHLALTLCLGFTVDWSAEKGIFIETT